MLKIVKTQNLLCSLSSSRCSFLNAAKGLKNVSFVDGAVSSRNRATVCWPFSHLTLKSRSLHTQLIQFNESELAEEEKKKPEVDPSRDRTKIIPPETSIRYLKSKAYETTYGKEPVWVKYRRNFKGQICPEQTRSSCVIGGRILTGNPCPICRDEYLVLHYTNVDLLKQFIHPQTGEIYDSRVIHICRKKLLQLQIAIKLAKFYGLLTYDVPFRNYDYSEYYPELRK